MSVRAWLCAVAATASLTVAGCGGNDSPSAPPTHTSTGSGVSQTGSPASSASGKPAGGSDSWGDPAAAAAGGKVGPGTACPNAPAFDAPANWKLTGDFSAIGGLTVADTFDLVCELDAKPAGVLGIMRVFASTKATGDLRSTTETLVKAWDPHASGLELRTLTVNGAEVSEVRYQTEEHNARAFVGRKGTTTFAVQWGGVDQGEHEAGLPAYVLARTSA